MSIAVDLPPDLLARLEERAIALGVSLSAAALAAARLALRATPSPDQPLPRVIPRRDGAPAVAFLAALTAGGACDWVIPLAAGKNVVHRSQSSGQHDWRDVRGTPLVEAGQWLLRCAEDRSAEVADGWSTNGSRLVPAAAVASLPAAVLDSAVSRLQAPNGHPAIIDLPHPGTNHQQPVWHPIAEGDLLLGVYRAFVFGWV